MKKKKKPASRAPVENHFVADKLSMSIIDKQEKVELPTILIVNPDTTHKTTYLQKMLSLYLERCAIFP